MMGDYGDRVGNGVPQGDAGPVREGEPVKKTPEQWVAILVQKLGGENPYPGDDIAPADIDRPLTVGEFSNMAGDWTLQTSKTPEEISAAFREMEEEFG